MSFSNFTLDPINSFIPNNTKNNISIKSINNTPKKYCNILEGLENDDAEEFLAVSSYSRFNVDNAKNTLRMLENQIINTKQNKEIARKNKNHNQKSSSPPKFIFAGNLKSDWVKKSEKVICNLDNEKINYKKKIFIKNNDKQFINPKFNENKFSKYMEIKNWTDSQNCIYNPFNDEILNNKFNEDILDKNVFIISENLLYALCINDKSHFPYNLNIRKKGNNYCIYSDLNDDSQSFVNYNTIGENNYELLPKNEKEIIDICFESNLIEENIKYITQMNNLVNIQENDLNFIKNKFEKKYEYVEIEIDDKIIIYTKIESGIYDDKNNMILCKSLNEYTKPSKWKKSWNQNQGSLINECYRTNINKISKWIIQYFLLKENNKKEDDKSESITEDNKSESITEDNKSEKILENNKSEKVLDDNKKEEIVEIQKDDYMNIYYINKTNLGDKNELIYMENVKINKIINYLGLKFDTLFSCLRLNLKTINELESDGDYILNKQSYKQNIKLYQVPLNIS